MTAQGQRLQRSQPAKTVVRATPPRRPFCSAGRVPLRAARVGGRQPLQPLSPRNVARAREGVLLYFVLTDSHLNSYVWLVATLLDSAGVGCCFIDMFTPSVVDEGAIAYLLL